MIAAAGATGGRCLGVRSRPGQVPATQQQDDRLAPARRGCGEVTVAGGSLAGPGLRGAAMTGGVGQVGGNAMSLRPEMPAVAAISRRPNP